MNYDVRHIWEDQEDIRPLCVLPILSDRRHGRHAGRLALDYAEQKRPDFFMKRLKLLGLESKTNCFGTALKTRDHSLHGASDHANSAMYNSMTVF